MGPLFIVPAEIGGQLSLKCLESQWYDNPSRALVLERQNEALDDGNGAVLPNCPESRIDAPCQAPTLIVLAELWTLVTDDGPRNASCHLNGDIQPVSDLVR